MAAANGGTSLPTLVPVMNKKVLGEIVAAMADAAARARNARRRGKARVGKATLSPSYSRAETIARGDRLPARGALCHHCGLRIPDFAELRSVDRRRIRELIRNHRPIMARQELRTITGCSLLWAKIWVQHAGRPLALRPGPPCPFCREPLKTSRAQECASCARSWYEEPARDPDRMRIAVDPTARCYPPGI